MAQPWAPPPPRQLAAAPGGFSVINRPAGPAGHAFQVRLRLAWLKVMGLSTNTEPNQHSPHRHTGVVLAKGTGWGASDGDLAWGGEPPIQCTCDVLENWTPKSCTILLTNITPIYSTNDEF